MRVLVDCDDTLAHFTDPFLELITPIVGKRYYAEDFNTWSFDSGFSEEIQKAIWDKLDSTPGFIRNLPILEGAEQAITELRQISNVIALTAPHIGPYWFYERALWLKDFGFKRKTMAFMAYKEAVKADVFVDDNPEHINNWKTAHPEGLALLLNKPNTKSIPTIGIRVENWEQALDNIFSFYVNRHKTT